MAIDASRRINLRLVLLVTFIVTAVTYILSYGLYLLLIRPSPTSSLTQLYNLLNTTLVFAFNPTFSFVIFYHLGSMLDFESNSDYIDLLKYAFVGGALGFAVGYTSELEMANIALGANLSLTEIFAPVSLADTAVGTARAGLGAMFLAFTGVAFRHLRTGGLLAAGKGSEDSKPPEGTVAQVTQS